MRSLIPLVGFIASLISAHACYAAVAIYAASDYDPTTNTGYHSDEASTIENSSVLNANGVAISTVKKMEAGVSRGYRGVQWSSEGSNILPSLTVANNPTGDSYPKDINNAGWIVGSSRKAGAGLGVTSRPVQWRPGASAPIEMPLLPSPTANAYGGARAVNEAGVSVGTSTRLVSGGEVNDRAARWNAAGTAVTELGTLGLDEFGHTNSYALDVNASGQAVGESEQYAATRYVGSRAVRWSANGVATELQTTTDSIGGGDSRAFAINDAGISIGSQLYVTQNGSSLGNRATRWRADGTAEILGVLGARPNGVTETTAYAINVEGDVAGSVYEYINGAPAGQRAVRWDHASAMAIPLQQFDQAGPNGFPAARAMAIDNLSRTVGMVFPVAGNDQRTRAVLWRENGNLLDLNSLIDPNNGWFLLSAHQINDSGWVSGIGTFDPDGAGPAIEYQRSWVLQIPEPSSAGLFVLLCGIAGRPRKR